MATSTSDVHTTDDDPSSKISPWARGENLRHVEKEVLIPKIVREKAKAKCDDFVKGRLHVEQRCFADRTNADFSGVWAKRGVGHGVPCGLPYGLPVVRVLTT